ncbi:hypothetical protein DMP15_00005, partial [Pseudonocardia sp. UM4_GMWB1]
ALNQVDPTPFTWQVPGLREELVTALIRTLPRNLRRNFSPAPDHAKAVLARLRRDRPAAAARRPGGRARPDARRGDPARGLGAGAAARAPHGDLPGARRVRCRAGPRHRPGQAAPRPRPEGAGGAGRRGQRRRGDRADVVDDRRAPPRAADPAWRAHGHRLPGPARPRHERRRPGVRDGARARPRPPPRGPAAPAPQHHPPGEAGAARPGQPGAAGPVAQPARLARRPARRLHHRRRPIT